MTRGRRSRWTTSFRDSVKLRAWDLEGFGGGQAAFLSEFRERYSFNIKWLSHRGAIPAVYEFHPEHWQDPKTCP